jgi:hypothetical protein
MQKKNPKYTTPFLDLKKKNKNKSKVRSRRKPFESDKGIREKPTADITLNGKRSDTSTSRSGSSHSELLLRVVLEVL